MADVTGEQPAVADGPGGFLGLVPVALHDVRTAHADLPGLAGAEDFAVVALHGDFDVGNGQADGAGFA